MSIYEHPEYVHPDETQPISHTPEEEIERPIFSEAGFNALVGQIQNHDRLTFDQFRALTGLPVPTEVQREDGESDEDFEARKAYPGGDMDPSRSHAALVWHGLQARGIIGDQPNNANEFSVKLIEGAPDVPPNRRRRAAEYIRASQVGEQLLHPRTGKPQHPEAEKHSAYFVTGQVGNKARQMVQHKRGQLRRLKGSGAYFDKPKKLPVEQNPPKDENDNWAYEPYFIVEKPHVNSPDYGALHNAYTAGFAVDKRAKAANVEPTALAQNRRMRLGEGVWEDALNFVQGKAINTAPGQKHNTINKASMAEFLIERRDIVRELAEREGRDPENLSPEEAERIHDKAYASVAPDAQFILDNMVSDKPDTLGVLKRNAERSYDIVMAEKTIDFLKSGHMKRLGYSQSEIDRKLAQDRAARLGSDSDTFNRAQDLFAAKDEKVEPPKPDAYAAILEYLVKDEKGNSRTLGRISPKEIMQKYIENTPHLMFGVEQELRGIRDRDNYDHYLANAMENAMQNPKITAAGTELYLRLVRDGVLSPDVMPGNQFRVLHDADELINIRNDYIADRDGKPRPPAKLRPLQVPEANSPDVVDTWEDTLKFVAGEYGSNRAGQPAASVTRDDIGRVISRRYGIVEKRFRAAGLYDPMPQGSDEVYDQEYKRRRAIHTQILDEEWPKILPEADALHQRLLDEGIITEATTTDADGNSVTTYNVAKSVDEINDIRADYVANRPEPVAMAGSIAISGAASTPEADNVQEQEPDAIDYKGDILDYLSGRYREADAAGKPFNATSVDDIRAFTQDILANPDEHDLAEQAKEAQDTYDELVDAGVITEMPVKRNGKMTKLAVVDAEKLKRYRDDHMAEMQAAREADAAFRQQQAQAGNGDPSQTS